MPENEPALWTAASLGQTQEVRHLLMDGAVIEEKGGPDECSPLHEAVREGHINVVRVLLEYKADASTKDNTGTTPLHVLVSHDRDAFEGQGHLEVPRVLLAISRSRHLVLHRLLLEHGAGVSTKNNNGTTPMHLAADWHPRLVEFLIAHGADPFAKDEKGTTPLHSARHKSVVHILLDQGADINVKDTAGKTPLYEAISANAFRGQSDMVRVLLKRGADVTAEDLASAEARTVDKNHIHHKEIAAIYKKNAALLRAALLRAEQTRRAKCVAFAMAQHERLGVGSLFSTLPPEMMQQIMFLV